MSTDVHAGVAGGLATQAGENDDARLVSQRFAFWGIAAAVGALVVLVGVSLYRTRGHLAYVVDDGGIHLSLAWNLAHHGTWGVVPGHFESASSSPAWTIALAVFARALPRTAFEYVPLALSALAGAWLSVVLSREQTIFGIGRRQWLQLPAIAAITVVVLFIPGLAMTGMEHVLHCALVVQVVVLFGHAADGRPLSRWAYPLLVLATLTRFETVFVAAGLVVAQALPIVAATRDVPWRDALRTARQMARPAIRRALGITAASLGTVAVFGFFNLAMGQSLFPNSIIHKTVLARGSNNTSYGVVETLNNMAKDPLVLLFFAAAVVYVLATHRQAPTHQLVFAMVLVVAVPLHSAFGQYGWFERYQSYLVALGVLFALSALGGVLGTRRAGIVAIAVIALTLAAAPTKLQLLVDTPLASKNTYLQRYQAGRFLQHFYRGEAVATGELGYISFFHEGPLTDVFGLGDHEVLERRVRGNLDAAYFEQLIRERHAEVIAVYPYSLWKQIPKSWTLVGLWRLDLRSVTAFHPTLQFYAPDHERAARLHRNLEEWASRLPPGIHTEVNPFSGFQSDLPPMPCC
jgi:hypothetical protein